MRWRRGGCRRGNGDGPGAPVGTALSAQQSILILLAPVRPLGRDALGTVELVKVDENVRIVIVVVGAHAGKLAEQTILLFAAPVSTSMHRHPSLAVWSVEVREPGGGPCAGKLATQPVR